MVKTLKKAIAEVETLPAADQEEIARRLIAHVEKLRALRSDIDAGLHSLDAGRGKPLDIEQFLQTMKRSDGRS
jgi:hypothetical protein